MRLTCMLYNINIHSTRNLFKPLVSFPIKIDTSSKIQSCSQKLMLATGIIHQSHNGFFHFLPLGLRALKKLTALVESYMDRLKAQQVLLPSLTPCHLWKSTGRLELAGEELFQLQDRHGKNFVLAPTHEESIAHLISTIPLFSYKNLPILLYQITNKYRDEMRPRFGIIRSKEFLMKDLYSFDRDTETAKNTYNSVSKAYEEILDIIGCKYVKVAGTTGLMGGSFSHEFHYPAEIGDDLLMMCRSCGYSWNRELDPELTTCKECSSAQIEQKKGIEVGHTFLLGTKYSSILQAKYNNELQKHEDLVMGSYGLGLSRILAATLEVLSMPTELRWPSVLAPFSVVIITPKEGSKEALAIKSAGLELYHTLHTIGDFTDDVLLDDRDNFTIGRRLAEAKATGYPRIIVIGKSALENPPLFEFHTASDSSIVLLTFSELISHISGQNNKISHERAV